LQHPAGKILAGVQKRSRDFKAHKEDFRHASPGKKPGREKNGEKKGQLQIAKNPTKEGKFSCLGGGKKLLAGKP